MAKKPFARKPHTAPEHDHAIMSEAEQAKFLGRDDEVVTNLGHSSRQDDLTQNPAAYPRDYEQGPAAKVINEKRSVGVYQKFSNPQSGISQQQNLDRWADYARSNSYTGHGSKAGPGKPPSMPDPRGRHSNESDGYLASTKNWPDFEYGSESGPGRIEKTHK